MEMNRTTSEQRALIEAGHPDARWAADFARFYEDARWAVGWLMSLVDDGRVEDLDLNDDYIKRCRRVLAMLDETNG